MYILAACSGVVRNCNKCSTLPFEAHGEATVAGMTKMLLSETAESSQSSSDVSLQKVN